jgi:hypothetical protein
MKKNLTKRNETPRLGAPAYICRNCAFPYKDACPKQLATSIEKWRFYVFFSFFTGL